MSNFIRAYKSMPGDEELLAIEGIVIVDSTPFGNIAGVRVGVAALVGEFADMRWSYRVNALTGEVLTKPQPQYVFSPQDFIANFGNFDSTIGKFGAECGNGYAEVVGKQWPSGALIGVPVNLCSQYACRFWRFLPTCKSATDSNPIFPIQGGSVDAAREFRNSTNRANIGQRIEFGAQPAYAQGVDGTIIAAAAAATQLFASPGSNFNTVARSDGKTGVKVGDILVIGSLNAGAGTPQLVIATAATQYRVTAINANGTDLTVQGMDGANITWTAGMASAAHPWRIHAASSADTGGEVVLSGAAGYRVPCRPLDATINAALALAPTVAPLTATGATWDPLSGLAGITHPTQPLTYTAAIQAPNAVNAAGLDNLYQLALDALLSDTDPGPSVNMVWAARKSSSIAVGLRAHALQAYTAGRFRSAIISPSLATQTVAAYIGDAYPGVGSVRAEEVIYTAPGVQVKVAPAVDKSIATADGFTTTDGILDVTADSWMACLLTKLGPEFNPGQAASPVPETFAGILGLQRGAPAMDRGVYELFRAKGIAAFRIADGTTQFQSGVTASLTPGRTTINRFRMLGFIARTLGVIGDPYCKLPMTEEWESGLIGNVVSFLETLKGGGQPNQQRIVDYSAVFVTSDADREKGIARVLVKVRTLATADVIVFNCQIGAGVNVVTAV